MIYSKLRLPRFDSLIRDLLIKLNIYLINENSKIKDSSFVIFSHDYIGAYINVYGLYESYQLKLLKLNVLDKMPSKCVAVDIGANIGNHTVFLSNHFNKVIAFEPNPRSFELLILNTKKRENVLCHNIAVSDKNTILFMDVPDQNIGGAKEIKAELISTKSIHCVAKKLDDILGNTGKIDLIKLDIEGTEYQAIVGSQKIIEKHKPIILFEQGDDEIRCGSSPAIDLLKNNGYDFYVAERAFDDCETRMCKIVGLLFRIFFGDSIKLSKKDYFQKKFYQMILAIPTEKESIFN